MPYGKGTYGKKVGRPPKKTKSKITKTSRMAKKYPKRKV
tara:strand:- start:3125 stop:3241 length:117 start_codon:yes stop_codon:yes gene_type:complete